MAIDLNKIIQAAAEAAVEGQSPGRQQPAEKAKSKGLTGPRALLLGAGVYAAGRMLVRARGSGLVEQLQGRLADLEDLHLGGKDEEQDEDFEDDEDLSGDEPEGEYDEDEEPEGEYDEDEEPEGEDEDEEPEGEYDEDDEPEEEDEEEEDEPDEGARPRRRRTSAAGRNGRH